MARDGRGGAPHAARHEHPGAAEPQPDDHRLLLARRHQRLGRHLAADARLREPRGAPGRRSRLWPTPAAAAASGCGHACPSTPEYLTRPVGSTRAPGVRRPTAGRRAAPRNGGQPMSWIDRGASTVARSPPLDHLLGRATPETAACSSAASPGAEPAPEEGEHLLQVRGRRPRRARPRRRRPPRAPTWATT